MKKRQQGLTTVEAAIGATLMFIVLFGCIEIARAIFVWNFLDEATRRGARVAAVCPIDHPAVARAAIFADPQTGTKSPHLGNLEPSDIDIDYMDANGAHPSGFEETRFVRVCIGDCDNDDDRFQLPLLFFKTVTWTTPKFTTILPSESLGYNPDNDPITCECWGDLGPNGGDGCG